MDTTVEVHMDLAGPGQGERLEKLATYCAAVSAGIVGTAQKNDITVADSLCCSLSAIADLASQHGLRVEIAAVMEKWAVTLRDPNHPTRFATNQVGQT